MIPTKNRRRFVDAPGAMRCTAVVTLRDGSTASCGRRHVDGVHCAQHAAKAAREAYVAAQRECAALGWSLTFDAELEEYRAAPRSGTAAQREARAYYSADLADAVGTVRAEAQRQRASDLRRSAQVEG